MKAIEFNEITKSFGDFYANSGITFSINKNDVHCILGENGAGKTTLMNILYGIHKPDSGKLLINGSEVHFNSPLDAISHKIGMVHQHFMLIEDFSVLENVILGNEISEFDVIDFKKSREIINALIKKYRLNLNIECKISDLNISQQQKVEILKLLYRNSDILIFDEPTSVLSPVEIHEFFKIVDEFKSEGKTVIFITHKLKEVMEISDKVTVLSRGKVTFEKRTKDEELDLSELSRAITGKEETHSDPENIKNDTEGEVVLTMKDICLFKDKLPKLKDFEIRLSRGEIYGVCGVEGNGQNEIADLIMGFENNYSGELIRLTKKVSIIPEDRNKKGMIKEYSIGENFILKFKRNRYVSDNQVRKISEDVSQNFDVRLSSVDSDLDSLSGGNQQKVIFARELTADNDIIILMHPTRGVDINASGFIHKKILEERNKMKAILLISSDLDELIKLSDRLGVIYNGKIVKEFDKSELNRNYAEGQFSEKNPKNKFDIYEKIGMYMIGLADEE